MNEIFYEKCVIFFSIKQLVMFSIHWLLNTVHNQVKLGDGTRRMTYLKAVFIFFNPRCFSDSGPTDKKSDEGSEIIYKPSSLFIHKHIQQ